MENKVLTYYALYKFNQEFFNLNKKDKGNIIDNFCTCITEVGTTTWFYQVSPSISEYDILVWSNIEVTELSSIDTFMLAMGTAVNKFRQYILPSKTLWGMTKPSQYSKAKKSAQELDPFTPDRKPYFVIYPFSKTADWYLKSREQRQEMMNGHIVIGKKYTDITQLLLYSFGIQDQEFVVAYEMEDMSLFSDLVYELRMTEARLFTLNDTPIIMGIYRSVDELKNIYKSSLSALDLPTNN
ncbi:MAG: chlorite dismutase family protein [Bacteroidota bacterium]|nr:chlorite dismutase family protein [Bacteroidota bacterium]